MKLIYSLVRLPRQRRRNRARFKKNHHCFGPDLKEKLFEHGRAAAFGAFWRRRIRHVRAAAVFDAAI